MKQLLMLTGVLIALSGCAAAPVIEHQDIQNFEAAYAPEFGALRFKGVYAQTPLQSKQVSPEQIGKDLFITLRVNRKPGLGFNDFEYSVSLAPEIENVYFGNQKQLIWKRSDDY